MVTPKMQRGSHAMRVIWGPLGPDDDAEAAQVSEFPAMTVAIEGGSAQLLGRNHEGGVWWPLADTHGFDIKGPGLFQVAVNPWSVKPQAMEAKVTVVIYATKR